ncbi:MAG: polysaccharide biosynthesis/export family protein [Sphingomicrobium sp.]
MAILLAIATAGCAALPVSGPTGGAILHSGRDKSGAAAFEIVEVDSVVKLPAAPIVGASTLTSIAPPPTNQVGPGDVLNIAIYEPGIALFGGGSRGVSAGGVTFDPSANSEKLPPLTVDDAGYINLPFIGRIRASGHTTAQLAASIRGRLTGLSQDPQVLVGFQQSISNSVIVAGEVARPGRLVLATNRETLNDTIALAGGYRGEAKDVVARVERDGTDYEVRLADLLNRPGLDVSIVPGDRVTLISRPQSFSILGAPNKVEEMRFPRTALTLAQAVSLAGGANPSTGDAAAIFIFRYVPQPDRSEKPVVYHLNMMRAGAYFLSQRFAMRDGDILYIGNARANQPTKLVQLVSQLFVPIVTVKNTSGL